MLGVSLITSEGARTACRGSAIAIPVATLNVVPSIPAVGLVLALSVDRFTGMARAPGNLIGNCVATLVVVAALARRSRLPHGEPGAALEFRPLPASGER